MKNPIINPTCKWGYIRRDLERFKHDKKWTYVAENRIKNCESYT